LKCAATREECAKPAAAKEASAIAHQAAGAAQAKAAATRAACRSPGQIGDAPQRRAIAAKHRIYDGVDHRQPHAGLDHLAEHRLGDIAEIDCLDTAIGESLGDG
jgi:hypothetical protein